MAIDIEDFIEKAVNLRDPSLNKMIDDLEELGEEANGNSPEYRLLREAVELIENPPELKDGVTVILKCNYKGKKPDTELELSKQEADRLIKMAWAIKA